MPPVVRAKVGATVGVDIRAVVTRSVPPVTSRMTMWSRQCPTSGQLYATSAAVVTLSAAMPVTDADTGDIDGFVRGPATVVGTGIPVVSAGVSVIKVGIRHGSYGGACAAGAADGVRDVDIVVASLVSTFEGQLTSLEMAGYGPLNGSALVSSEMTSVSSVVTSTFIPTI